MSRSRIISASLAVLTGGALLFAGQYISSQRHQAHLSTCRLMARHVMQEALADRMDTLTATRRLDGACGGVSPSERKTIVDTERSAALARETEQ